MSKRKESPEATVTSEAKRSSHQHAYTCDLCSVGSNCQWRCIRCAEWQGRCPTREMYPHSAALLSELMQAKLASQSPPPPFTGFDWMRDNAWQQLMDKLQSTKAENTLLPNTFNSALRQLYDNLSRELRAEIQLNAPANLSHLVFSKLLQQMINSAPGQHLKMQLYSGSGGSWTISFAEESPIHRDLAAFRSHLAALDAHYAAQLQPVLSAALPALANAPSRETRLSLSLSMPHVHLKSLNM